MLSVALGQAGRSLLQRDPMAPSMFVALMDVLLESIVEVFNENGLGLRDHDLWLSFWLLGITCGPNSIRILNSSDEGKWPTHENGRVHLVIHTRIS